MGIMIRGIRLIMRISLKLFIQVTFATVTVLACRTKEDCLEGYSCVDNICQKCLKCNILLRKGESCVVDFNECGECLEGFEEISVTHFSNIIKPCKPIKKKIKLKECIHSSNCPPNNYCNEGTCIKCFDCSLINRLTPVGKCATGLNDCGSCRSGFHAVAVTTDTNTKACEVNTSVSQETHNSQKFLHIVIGPLTLGVIMLKAVRIVIMTYRGQRVNKNSSQSIHNAVKLPSAPPLYEFDASQIVTEDKDLSSIHYERERNQQAKVFKLPTAAYYWEEEEESNNDETRGDQISGNNEDILSGSFDANRSEPEESGCSGEILTLRFDGLIVNDSVDSSPQQPNEILTGYNNFPSMNSVEVDVVDSVQVDEDLVNDTSTVHVVPTSEQGQL